MAPLFRVRLLGTVTVSYPCSPPAVCSRYTKRNGLEIRNSLMLYCNKIFLCVCNAITQASRGLSVINVKEVKTICQDSF